MQMRPLVRPEIHCGAAAIRVDARSFSGACLDADFLLPLAAAERPESPANESGVFSNSPAKPPALPERIEAVLQLREQGHKIIRSPWGNREALKEIAMSQDHNHLNHATWECKYHVVFTPKYRKKALFGQIRRHLGTVFRELARRKECQIEEGHLMPDHVHMLISIPPKYSVAEVIGYLKGKSSIWIAQNVERKMRNFLGHKFWARGYFVSTVGRDEEMIRAYIKNQELADKQLDQMQLKLASS
jgi:REP-associated tyrosine transposase